MLQVQVQTSKRLNHINSLHAFINYVEAQRGVNITDADADALIASAQAIIASLGG